MENLTEKDQAIIAQLIDPDVEAQAKYPYSSEFQQVLIGMLLCDRFFLSQSFGLIKPHYFSSEVHQFISRFVFDFFEKYKNLPSKIFVRQGTEEFLKKKYANRVDDFGVFRTIYLGELKTIYDYYTKGGVGNLMPGLDPIEAILDKITTFAKTQAMKTAFHRSLELIRRNPEVDETWDQVNQIIKEAQLVNRNFDFGLDYFQTVEERYERMRENEQLTEIFSTGFDKLDSGLAGGGMVRGEIGAVMALPGRGKSLNLVLAAVKNIARGKKVLYVTTEMRQDRVAVRFDAMFSLIGQHKLLQNQEEVMRALRGIIEEFDDKQRLVVKQFPSGTADISTVKAYHSQLIMFGFRPDLVIIDYPGDMKEYPGIKTYESMFRWIRDLKGFGAEEDHCTLIAIQPNRDASELTIDDFMDESKQGGSFDQNKVFDVFWTLNQIAEEKKAGIGRLFVAKARNGKANYSFKIYYDFSKQTLMLSEISEDKYKRLRISNQNTTSDDTESIVDTVAKSVYEPSEGELV